MIVYLIRHAKVQKGRFLNPNKKHNDPSIDKCEKRKTIELYKYLKNKNITCIYTSEYARTQETINYTAQKLKLIPIIDSRLNEIDYGELGTLPYDQLYKKYPNYNDWFDKRVADNRFPNGETCTEAQQRICNVLESVKTNNGNVVIVSHGGLIRTILCFIFDKPVYNCFQFEMDNIGLMEIEYKQVNKENKWYLVRYNQTI